MTERAMRIDPPRPVAPILVLGIGNPLLADDGVGLELLGLLRDDFGNDPRVELVDGGTQGMMLVGLLENRSALLLLDAVQGGAPPGHVHRVHDTSQEVIPRGFGAHGGNASELLAAARLLGVLPERVALIGIEPSDICTRVGLSSNVADALPPAAAHARRQLSEWIAESSLGESTPCTS